MQSESKGNSSKSHHETDDRFQFRKSPEKIMTTYNGFLLLKKDNLLRIMQDHQKDDHAIAFVTVVGPPQSGKSFITNLLIHLGKNLEKGKVEGGWLESLVNEDGEFPEGFSFGSMISPAPGSKLFETSGWSWSINGGVYLWPTPYLKRKSNGEIVHIWILHYQIPFSSPNDSEAIENFLGLSCSRIMEIMIGNGELRVGRMREYFSVNGTGTSSPTNACDSVVVVHLSEDAKSTPTPSMPRDGEAKKLILDLRQFDKSKYESILDEFKHLNLTQLQKISEPLHDKNGRFNQDAIKPLIGPFKTAINTFLMEDDGIMPKKITGGEVLTASKVVKFLEDCVNYFNKLNSGRAELMTMKHAPLEKAKVTREECEEIGVLTPKSSSSTSKRKMAFDIEKWIGNPHPNPKLARPQPPLIKTKVSEAEAAVHESNGIAMKIEDSQEEKKPLESHHELPPNTDSKLPEKLKLTAIDQVKEKVREMAFSWVTKYIRPENVHNFKSIFDPCFHTVLENNYRNHNEIAPHLWNKFCEAVHAGSHEACVTYLSIAFDPVREFDVKIREQLNRYGYITSPEQFEQMVAETSENCITIRAEDHPKFNELMTLGMANLSKIYKTTNAAIMASEKVTREKMRKSVKAFYNEEMQRYLEEKYFTRTEFFQVHRELVARLMESCRNIANASSSREVIPEDAQKWLLDLERELNSIFVEHQRSNVAKLAPLPKRINKLVEARYDEYVKEMKEILQKHPEGYEPEKLKWDHEAISKQQQNLLGMEVRKLVRETEPTEGYCESLLYKIIQYWPTLVEANEENFKRKWGRGGK